MFSKDTAYSLKTIPMHACAAPQKLYSCRNESAENREYQT